MEMKQAKIRFQQRQPVTLGDRRWYLIEEINYNNGEVMLDECCYEFKKDGGKLVSKHLPKVLATVGSIEAPGLLMYKPSDLGWWF